MIIKIKVVERKPKFTKEKKKSGFADGSRTSL